ncbi:TldD/PmbA family protein [Gilvimarinus sp. SDUM040013]|uniref:TldD/PmbA family protein n=1 Tax=Gilvimarinus gilvus TaxID=3058038 RepID=A0ABU4S4I9_9GAMM|nr:TldD/PmbA family protein [Gilvimarinus sp. SDUM040013]MDO3386897.1 TldD/PmbA family protein [Gilvimarinus sp. SDUM040013]MDX6851336.1 TldD/PmbA family protein [Gilvimarinus sp. SDUM040013]
MLTRAKQILAAVEGAGFDDARVTITETNVNELNVAHNHVSLMRTTESQSLAVMAIQDKRRVSASVSRLDELTVEQVIADMQRDVANSPQDEAYAVAAGQTGQFERGPQTPEREAIAAAAKSLLQVRSEQFPTFQIEECAIKHSHSTSTLVSTQGAALVAAQGHYRVGLMGSSKDEHGSSSFTFIGGELNALPARLAEVMDIELLMANSARETRTEMIGEKFTGDVVLMPMAVMDLVGWLTRQLGDAALLSHASVYQNAVGECIATPALSIRNNPQGAGQPPFNGEGFVIQPVTLLDQGKLTCQLPSYIGSRKLGIPYTPFAGGWCIDGGDVSRADMLAGVEHGALVGRLSMGSPAPNGDFSGVIKNSFLLESGKQTKALSETMITGNVAQMLQDIQAISREVTDFGGSQLPWLKISGLRFS